MTSNNRKILGRFGLGASTASLALGLAFAATPAFAQSTAPAPAPAPEAPATADTGGTIVVTGSRISNPNLTSLAPVTVVTATELKTQGTVRVEDMLNSLPQVYASEGSSDANGASGIATVDLRNLGTSRTLVLVNGRRLGAGDPTDIASDLNFIPGSLIKRVDVLTGGASATYGSDALAGVVNFVMNTDFEGIQLDGQYSLYQHDNRYNQKNFVTDLAAHNFQPPRGNTVGGAIKTATATFGTSVGDGRGHITAYASWRTVNAITQGDRDYSYCGFSAETSAGTSAYDTCGGSSTSAFGRFRRTTNTAVGATPVYTPTGTSYTANQTVRGAGGAFGTYNGARDGFNFNPQNYFQRPDTRYTAGLFANYDVSDAFKPYMEFMFMDDHTKAQIGASGAFYGTDFFVNCNNPLMTAAQQAQLCPGAAGTNTLQSVYIGRRNVEGGGRIDDLRHTDYRAVLGAKGNIADGITYEVYGSLWKSLLAEEYLNDFSRVRINRALNVVQTANGPVCASAIPNAQGQVVDASCVPWNIFTGTTSLQGSTAQGVTQAALNYLATPGFQHGSNSEYVVSGVLSFDLGKRGIQTPWADSGAQLVLGTEYRKEKISLVHDAEFLTGDLAGQGTPFGVPDVHGGYDVKEGFAELQVPLVTNQPGIEALGFDAAYRYSKYSIQGTTNTYKASVEYAPIKQVRFRAGYNRAVRAPNSLELFSPSNVVLFGGSDPCTGTISAVNTPKCALTGVTFGAGGTAGTIDANPSRQYNQQTAGNPNLKPEVGDTITAGFVVNPIRNLSISVDYYNIKIKDEITTYGAQFILNQCFNGVTSFCPYIHRSSGGSLWTGAGYVANPTLNLSKVQTDGVDINANYRVRFGKESSISFDLNGTYLHRYKISPGAGLAAYDCAGAFGINDCVANGEGGTPLPKWRHKFRVTYQVSPAFGISGAWRYIGGTTNDLVAIEHLPVAPTSSTITTASVNSLVAKIPKVSYFDLSAVASIGDHYTLRMGVQNLFDKQPPILDLNYSNNGSNTYANVYDALGRYVYVAIQLNF